MAARVIRVWGTGRINLWSPEGNHTIPIGFAFIKSGDAVLTRAIKSKSQTVYEVMEKRRKNYPSVVTGIWAELSIITREQQRLASLRTPDHKQKLKAKRQRKQEKIVSEFISEILSKFPRILREEAQSIAEHACEVGSGRVGRSSTADDPVTAAVIARIRHNYTDYDDLRDEYRTMGLKSDEARQEARENIGQQIKLVLKSWR